jgi:hypothetical protein
VSGWENPSHCQETLPAWTLLLEVSARLPAADLPWLPEGCFRLHHYFWGNDLPLGGQQWDLGLESRV